MTARGYLRSPEAAGLTMIIRWCMGVTGVGIMELSMAKEAIKIF